MFGPQKQILWAKHVPLPFNPYPVFQSKSLCIGGENKKLAIYVPLILSQRNVKQVDKEESEEKQGGKNLSLQSPKDLKGKGTSSFQYPVKVLFTYYLKICFLL